MKRLQLLLAVLSVLLLIVAAAVGWGWWQMQGSLAQLDGNRPLAGLSAPVRVERDALGVPVITGATRADVARATGFLHAQDRYFQMDLLRRSAAGELAEIFGGAAVPIDRTHRTHGFRRTAEKVVAALDPDKRAVLDAYTGGVNAGLAALPKIPWEYLVLRVPPQPWRAEDSLLAAYAMWLDLQDATGGLERSVRAVRLTLGQAGMEFFAPRGNSWDSALDGSTFAPASLPPLRLKAPPRVTAGVTGNQASSPAFRLPAAEYLQPGSNNFAVSGAHTASGAAMLANDMHLSLTVPHIWYRAVLQWRDAAGTARRVVGITLPGAPLVVVGSNGRIAWGFTNSNIDTADIVLVETEITSNSLYRTAHGWMEIEERREPIKVKGGESVPFTVRWTEWGPIIGGPEDGRFLALRWNAHSPESTNTNLMEMETATTAVDAVAIAHRVGMPNQNLLVADADGAIAWTLTGTVPQRIGYDGRQPVSWAFGDRRWDGWLPPGEVPVILNPAEGLLWTANQRVVGGAALAKLGDAGYDTGARGGQIRDDLRVLVAAGKKVVPADLLAIQLDDRALFLARWQKLLLTVLTDDAVAGNRVRGELREAVRQWNGRASTDSAAFRLVRAFRLKTAEQALSPFFAKARDSYDRFSYDRFLYEDALWRLVEEKPGPLLNPAHESWDALLLAAVDDVIAEADLANVPLARYTWGARNTLRMKHPFGRFLPATVARWLDMPADQLPGANDMPRVQSERFGASERLVVSPGHEAEALFHMPGGQSGHPLSPYYRAGHDAWVKGSPTPLLPGPVAHTLVLTPQ